MLLQLLNYNKLYYFAYIILPNMVMLRVLVEILRILNSVTLNSGLHFFISVELLLMFHNTHLFWLIFFLNV